MQSENELGKIVDSTPVDLGNASELLAKIKSAQEKGAVKHTIGNLPKSGDVLEIGGLKYSVDFADYIKGKFNLRLSLL